MANCGVTVPPWATRRAIWPTVRWAMVGRVRSSRRVAGERYRVRAMFVTPRVSRGVMRETTLITRGNALVSATNGDAV